MPRSMPWHKGLFPLWLCVALRGVAYREI